MNTDNIKCTYHQRKDIILVCTTCNNEPICVSCLTSNHKKHDFCEVDQFKEGFKKKIAIDFKYNTLPQLDKLLDNNRKIRDESNNHFKKIEDKHVIDLATVSKQFKQLHDIISSTEVDIVRQLITILEENTETNTVINSTLDSIDKTVTQIIDNSRDQLQFIQILKNNHQCKSYIDNNNTNNNNELPDYKDITLNIKHDLIDSMKDTIKSIIEISTNTTVNKPRQLIKKELKKMKYWKDTIFTIYEDGCEMPEGVAYLAIGYGHHLPPIIPKSVIWLLLPDGFDCQSLDSIPPNVNTLFLFDIKFKLFPGSIPKKIKGVVLCGGFSQNTVDWLTLPRSVKIVNSSENYKFT